MQNETATCKFYNKLHNGNGFFSVFQKSNNNMTDEFSLPSIQAMSEATL